jgi:Protein of unknown function (DUF3602)
MSIDFKPSNVTSKEGVTVDEQKKTPTLKSEKYTAARGGAENIVTSDPDNPVEARKVLDVDVPPILLPEGQNRTGRGNSSHVEPPSAERRLTAIDLRRRGERI